ncbi:hypothetical protein ACFFS4_21830 [Kutzneria kofuensis]|uniref:HAF family extracellular repeat protein n=1 Tax=Kutzneria kofuensis TaxID=103725 RepID=A0A7W9NL61_9PSEU|nr:hypothetical protein [Kutzneria kofuensis]MBB5897337.1 hypothetical protein [Kutzneria kofuensis]
MRAHAWMTALTAGALVSTMICGSAEAATDCAWSGTPLPHDGVTAGTAQVLAAPGDILGFGDGRLLRWHNGTLTSTVLPDGATQLRLRGADGAGRVAGTINSPQHAITVRDGKITEYPVPTGASNGEARGVNQRGDVAGFATGPGPQQRRYLIWTDSTTGNPTEVLVHADQFRTLSGIADDRRLVLDWATTDGHTRAATFLGGTATLLALPEGATDSWTTAVAGSWIIGKAGTQPQRSVVWDPTGAPRLLPAGFDAVSVNRSGVIAGYLDGQAAVQTPDGTVHQLGSGTELGSVADDGTVLGAAGGVPTTWTCR